MENDGAHGKTLISLYLSVLFLLMLPNYLNSYL